MAVKDVGDTETKEVDAEGYQYAWLGFLKTCTWWGGWTLVDGKVSTFKKEKRILTGVPSGQSVGPAGPGLVNTVWTWRSSAPGSWRPCVTAVHVKSSCTTWWAVAP